MFVEERTEPKFEWSMLGDIDAGRPNLGANTKVAVYRLMQYSLRDMAIQLHGVEAASKLFYEAGKVAGKCFCDNLLDKNQSLTRFVGQLQDVLRDLNIGVLRVEKADTETLNFTLTVAEDLDCSGLPVCDEQICTWDEGFIAGLLEAYAHREFDVKETDCWCSGDRVCRFDVKPR